MALKLWLVENRPSQLLWPLAYTTACTTVQDVIKTVNNIYLFITKYSLLRLHLVSRKIFTYFQWGVETNLAKIQNHNTVQGYNSEENPFKIIFLCFFAFDRLWSWSATFDSHPAARGRSWIPLGNWRHVMFDEQFLTSPFLPAHFHRFTPA